MSETKTNNKSQGDKEMWTLLNKIFDFMVGLPWKRFWEWLTHIPNIIKYLLIITILGAGAYLVYSRVYTRNNIQEVQTQVLMLNKRIENVLSAADYEVDVEYMIVTLYLLEELNEQQWQISKMNTTALIRHMRHINPNDPLIMELESSQKRLEQQHNALKRHFQTGIQKFCPSDKEKANAQNKADEETYK